MMLNTLSEAERNWIMKYHSVEMLKVTLITAALTNAVFLLHFVDNTKLIFKRLNQDARNNEERGFEVDIHSRAALAGLSTKIIAVSEQYRLQEYIGGQSLEGALVDKALLKLLAAQFQRIHFLPANVAMPQRLVFELTRLADQLGAKQISINQNEFTPFIQLAKQLDERSAKDTLCHGDLSLNNVIKTEAGEIKIIDWEYGVAACPAYDLAFCNGINEFSEQDQIILIEAYYLLHSKTLPCTLTELHTECKQYLSLFTYINKLWANCFI